MVETFYVDKSHTQIARRKLVEISAAFAQLSGLKNLYLDGPIGAESISTLRDCTILQNLWVGSGCDINQVEFRLQRDRICNSIEFDSELTVQEELV